ncbi:transketolase [Synechococcus sp. RS9916]|nr:transketolase [Synechococcus sp. RS9916]
MRTISAVLAIKKPPVVTPGVKTFELKPPEG